MATKLKTDTSAATPTSWDLFFFTDASDSDNLKEVDYSDLVSEITGAITWLDAASISDGDVSNTEFDYLNGVTSSIQTQLDAKASSSHTHTASDITDFDTEVANNSAVTANTAKVTNATHTWDVTWSATLTIADDAVTYAKMQNVVSDNVILWNNSGAWGIVDELTATEVRTIINVEDGADVTDTTNVTAAWALMDSELANITAVKALNQWVATTDTPQFVWVELWHASDTTITRVSAWVIAVEWATLATQAYADWLFASNDAMLFKWVIDCAASPNYPAADAWHTYKVSAAGKIGWASGVNVEVWDTAICAVDSTSSWDQATVWANWYVIQANLDGAVIWPASSTDWNFVLYDWTTGKLIKDSAYSPSSFQPIDDDLTIIAWLTATTNNFIQSVSSAWASRTPAQVTATLDAVVWDSGSWWTKWLVPAPAAWDAAAGKFLNADWTRSVPAWSWGGDVSKVWTPVDNQIGVWTWDWTIEGTSDFTFDGSDLVFYDATNDGNPEIRLWWADAEELHIQTVFDTWAQTLDYVLLKTDAASATANKWSFRFNVDWTDILDIDDGWISWITWITGAAWWLTIDTATNGNITISPWWSGTTTITAGSGWVTISTDSGNSDIDLSPHGTWSVNIAASKDLSFDWTAILSDSAWTMTLSNVDALDATTEATVEAAIDTLANLTSVQWHTVTLTWDLVRSGAHSLTLTTTGTTSVTLPTSWTLATESFVSTWYQPLDADLTALAWLTSAANKVPYFTGSGSAWLLDFKDEDTMSSDSATALASQQSIKAYVDTQVATKIGNVVEDTTPQLWWDLDCNGKNMTDVHEINIDSTPDTDHTANWPTTSVTAWATTAQFDVCMLQADGKFDPADASAAATANGMLVLSLEAKNDTESMKVALPWSFIRDDTWNWTVWGIIYLSETTGAMTQTAPTTSTAIVRILWYALSADIVYFNPSPDFIELA